MKESLYVLKKIPEGEEFDKTGMIQTPRFLLREEAKRDTQDAEVFGVSVGQSPIVRPCNLFTILKFFATMI